MYSSPVRSASRRSHTSCSSLASSAAAGPREELQHWLLAAEREVELHVVVAMEVGVIDVVPPRRMRHRLEGAELDASALFRSFISDIQVPQSRCRTPC
jgi:hypothetical protein